MPSKKKKYNARFPPARIKKIMQTDEEVGKVAAPVPVIISRALELFVESLLTKAVQITSAKNAKTLSPAHLKQCILDEDRFDFLKDLVLAIPDVQGDGDEQAGSSVPSTPTTQQQHPPIYRSQSEVTAGSSSASSSASVAAAGRSRGRGTGRPRGRPRKNPVDGPPVARAWPARTSKSDSESTETDEEDDDEDEDSDTDSKPPVARSRNGVGPTTVVPITTVKTNIETKAAAEAAAAAAFQFNAVQPNFYQEISNNGGGASQPFQIQITLPPIPAAVAGDTTVVGVGNGANPPSSSAADDEDYDT